MANENQSAEEILKDIEEYEKTFGRLHLPGWTIATIALKSKSEKRTLIATVELILENYSRKEIESGNIDIELLKKEIEKVKNKE